MQKLSLSLYFFPSFYSFVYLLYFPLSHLSEHTCIPPSLISFLSIWLSVVHAMFLFLSTKRHGGEALRPPPQPPSSFLHIIISKIYFNPSTNHSINQSNYPVCFLICLCMNPDPTMGGGAAPSPQPPPTFFICSMMIQKMYTCIHPSLIQWNTLCISLFLCLTLCRSCNVLVSVHQTPWGGCAAPYPPTPLQSWLKYVWILFFLFFFWSF